MKCLVLPILFLCLLGCQSNIADHSNTTTKLAQTLKPVQAAKNSSTKEPEIKTIVFVCTWGFDKSVIAASYFNELMKDKRFHYKAISRASKVSERNINNNIPTAVLIDILSTGLSLQSTDVIALSKADINTAYQIIYLDDPMENQNGNSKVAFWDNIPPLKAGVNKTTTIIKEKVDKLVKEIGC